MLVTKPCAPRAPTVHHEASGRTALAETAAPAAPQPPRAPRHGLGRLVDCVACLCPRPRRQAAARPMEAIEMDTFAPPRNPLPDLAVTRLPADARDARYRIHPPGFADAEGLLVHELPGVDGRTRYHEARNGPRGGLDVLNMLAMAVTGNDYTVLVSRQELDAFVLRQPRPGGLARNDYRAEDLRDFHNARHPAASGRPVLALVDINVRRNERLLFDLPHGPAQERAIDAAPAVGMAFEIRRVDPPEMCSVLVCRVGAGRFEMRDPRVAQPRFRYADSMSHALGGFMTDLGLLGEDPDDAFAGAGFRVLYPLGPDRSAEASSSPFTWL